MGKSCFLVASSLGVFPGQKLGGVVDVPKNLHVITFDANALGGIQSFIQKTCGGNSEALGFTTYNLQDSFRSVSLVDDDYSVAFYKDIIECIDRVGQKAAKGGVHALLFSSLTGLAAGIQRAIVGAPGKTDRNGKAIKGSGSDPSKWQALAAQLTEIQNFAQIDIFHCLWEAHLDKANAFMGGDDSPAAKESIRVSGQAGRSWAYNVEQVFQIARNYGTKVPPTQCDQVYLNTRPSLDFISNGRGFTENLEAKEYDLTHTFQKLGLKVGNWGVKSAVPNAVPTK